mmetsp:Transcript_28759/g.25881  ORF Transcript_28759/g.25881 Transcript_28759/m.25881 type:complete len:304 (+) Transcript_28759:1227-2138(+)
MIAKDKVAIVRFVPRTTSQVRFCALIPQQEEFDEDNFQIPPGFNLIFLPFSEDIRKLETVKPKTRTDVDRTQVVNAKLLIKSLSTEFDCRNFENPDIQTFYSNLQAIALNEPEPEEVVDLLEPDVEGMEKYSSVIEAFKDSVWDGRYTDPDSGFNPGGTSGRGRGKAKKGDDNDDDDGGFAKKKTKTTREKADRTDMDDKPKRGGGRKKKAADDDDEFGDDYDFDDDFIVDDRKKKGGKKGGSKKKDMLDEDEEWGDIEKLLREGETTKLKVADLKEYLKAKGQSATGKKDELIDRAYNYLTR